MLSCLIAPTAGRATINGFVVGRDDSRIRQIVGILTESPGLYEKLSAAQNLAFFARVLGVQRAEVDRAIEAVDLGDHRDHVVGNLSGGNQQKALLSRWVYDRPAVLLADEPTRGIDIGAKAHIMAALKKYAADGTTVLIVSSEFEELIAHCDRIVVLTKGRIVGEFRPAIEPVTESDLLNAAFAREEKLNG